eukprot:2894757-Amphidinium_carterae.1
MVRMLLSCCTASETGHAHVSAELQVWFSANSVGYECLVTWICEEAFAAVAAHVGLVLQGPPK